MIDGEKVEIENISEEDFFSKFYKPNSTTLQFVFQGANIFRGAVEDLLTFSEFGQAEEVVLAGSSAGSQKFWRLIVYNSLISKKKLETVLPWN